MIPILLNVWQTVLNYNISAWWNSALDQKKLFLKPYFRGKRLNSSHDGHAGPVIIFLRQEQMLYFQENNNKSFTNCYQRRFLDK